MAARERILVVESDPVISDLVARQALQMAGFQTLVVTDANSAIGKAMQFAPDVIIVNENLRGLSGKDLLVALTSQGIETPVIMLAPRGSETEIIQAFRLGATDYLLWPVREAEVINAVERVLKQVRDRRERERLTLQLQQINTELQQRARELTTIFAVGKAVISITDVNILFKNILEGAARVTQADLGWLMLRDDASKNFVVAAIHNLPASLPVEINKTWDDGISGLVAMSGESLSIYGEPIRRFKIAALGQSVLVVPIKVQRKVIGILVVMRSQSLPFKGTEQNLVEAVADYLSIYMVNVRLFKVVEDRARYLQVMVDNAQTGEKVINGILQSVKKEIAAPIKDARSALSRLEGDTSIRWNPSQREWIITLQDKLILLDQIAEAISPLEGFKAVPDASRTNLNEILRRSIKHFQPFARQSSLMLVAELPEEPLVARADPAQVSAAVEGILSTAIKNSNPGGEINIRLGKTAEGQILLSIEDNGDGFSPEQVKRLLTDSLPPAPGKLQRFGGLAVGMQQAQELILRQNGQLNIESYQGKGTVYRISIPMGD
jgi:DNA-binding response OmpR family regulator/two-component sensor histidine kinase